MDRPTIDEFTTEYELSGTRVANYVEYSEAQDYYINQCEEVITAYMDSANTDQVLSTALDLALESIFGKENVSIWKNHFIIKAYAKMREVQDE